MYTIKNVSDGTPIHNPKIANGAVCTGKLTQTKNEVDSLTIRIYPENPSWDNLQEMVTRVTAYNETTASYEFYGRVISVTPSMDSRGIICKDVVCEGALGFLSDGLYGYSNFTGWSAEKLLTTIIGTHNAICAETWKQFTIGAVGTQIASNFSQLESYKSALEILTSAAELSGGRLQTRYEGGTLYIDWLDDDASIDRTNAVVLGINMLSFSKEFDPTSICTRLWAWGPERVPLEIVQQPTSSQGKLNKRWSASVRADGATAYQWQASSDAGATWVNIPHYKSTVNLCVGKGAIYGYYYRCRITGQEGQTVYSDCVQCLQESKSSTIEEEDYTEEAEYEEETVADVNVDRIDLTSVLGRKYVTAADVGAEDIENEVGVINGYFVTGDAETASELLTLAKSEFISRNSIQYTFSADVVDLVYKGKATQTFQIGHRYSVQNNFFSTNEDVEVVGRTVSIESPHLPTLTLGAKATTMTKILAQGVK